MSNSAGQVTPVPNSGPDAAVLQAYRIEKEFRVGPERLRVLQAVDLRVQTGEMVAILGPSGSGKSTLLHILAGLDRPTTGEVVLAGQRLSTIAAEALARFRNYNVGLIFQFHHLLPEFSVLENVMMPCLISGIARAEARVRAEGSLADVSFTARMRHRPGELSGGEKQKVATARALVMNPRIVLADEPTGNLDFRSAGMLLELLKHLNSTKRVTLLVVTHNERVAALCDRRLYLDQGMLSDADQRAATGHDRVSLGVSV